MAAKIGKPKSLTASQHKELQELYVKGVSMPKLALHFKIGTSTVWYYIHRPIDNA